MMKWIGSRFSKVTLMRHVDRRSIVPRSQMYLPLGVLPSSHSAWHSPWSGSLRGTRDAVRWQDGAGRSTPRACRVYTGPRTGPHTGHTGQGSCAGGRSRRARTIQELGSWHALCGAFAPAGAPARELLRLVEEAPGALHAWPEHPYHVLLLQAAPRCLVGLLARISTPRLRRDGGSQRQQPRVCDEERAQHLPGVLGLLGGLFTTYCMVVVLC